MHEYTSSQLIRKNKKVSGIKSWIAIAHIRRELNWNELYTTKSEWIESTKKKLRREEIQNKYNEKHITIALAVYGIIWNKIMLHKKN